MPTTATRIGETDPPQGYLHKHPRPDSTLVLGDQHKQGGRPGDCTGRRARAAFEQRKARSISYMERAFRMLPARCSGRRLRHAHDLRRRGHMGD